MRENYFNFLQESLQNFIMPQYSFIADKNGLIKVGRTKMFRLLKLFD